MNSYVDNKLLRFLCASAESKETFLTLCAEAGLVAEDLPRQIDLDWPSLLEYIGQGNLYDSFQALDEHNAFLAFVLATLASDLPSHLYMELYDRIFVECLTSVKDLPQIQQAFLLSHIQTKQHLPIATLFSESLEKYVSALTDDPYNTIHDLTLYLAWDRMCVFLAVVFELFVPKDSRLHGLEVLKGCLIESFQHITGQRRTSPGFFRFIEALYAYHMRQENLQSHTDEEWLKLCQGARALKPREELSDVPYANAAVIDVNHLKDSKALRVFTLHSVERATATLALTDCMIQKLKREVPDWHYALAPVDIVFLKIPKA